MKISVIGCGWFGKELAQKLLHHHHQVLGTTRSQEKLDALSELGILCHLLTFPNLPHPSLMEADVVILNIPPFAAQGAWVRNWPWEKRTHLIFISSTSVYGLHQGEVDEETEPLPDSENGHFLLAEEKWVKSAPLHTIIRFGGLIGKNRHPGKQLSGRKNLKDGNLPVNLIHLDDCVNFTQMVIDQKLTGVFNLVSDNHSTREKFYGDYCKDHGLPLPEFESGSGVGKVVSNQKVKKLMPLSL